MLVVDNTQMKAAVLTHVSSVVAHELTKSGSDQQDYKEMLTRVAKLFVMIDKNKGLARAASERDDAQEQAGRNSKRQAQGGSTSSKAPGELGQLDCS